MTTPNSGQAATSTDDPARLPRRARVVLLVLFVIAAAGMAAFASSAFSQGFGPPWQARPFWGQTFDPATIEDRADRMVRHLSIEVDATPDQQERLRGIVRSAVRDLVPLRDKAATSRQRGRELLTQTTNDRAAIETLRAEQMAFADQATRRVSQALADAATVLSPEQRRKIAERIDRWRSYGHGWHRG
jgi:Spy/CpxP family protein refolding chaperone